MRAASLFTLVLFTAATIGAQSPQPFDSARGEAASVAQDQPTFRAGVELITVEASVLDSNGQPVADLAPADFEVTVAGRARPVRYARYHNGSLLASDAADPAASTVPSPIANRSDGGRIVVFVVDRDSIQQGAERALIEAATTLVDGLGPADASGLFEVPGAGMDLTREHERVKAGLRRLTGARPPVINPRDRSISWDEAIRFEQRDARVIAEVIERECPAISRPPGLRDPCPDDLRIQAAELLRTGRLRVQTVMSNLSSLAERLAPLRGPKQIVILSSGLPFGQDLLHWFNQFAQKAGEAGLVVSVVHFDPPEVDVTARRNVSSAFGGRDLAAGLGAIAGQTGGAFYTTGGSGAGIFDRIKTEMGHFYELAIDGAENTEKNGGRGGTLPIEVKVTRPGLTVRSRGSVAPHARSTAPLPERVSALLRQPTDLAELPLSVTAYTMRGDDVSTLRVVIAAEVGAERFKGPAEWSFAAFHEGNVVATGQQHLDAAGAAPWPAALSAKLLPGRYRLRVAAADAEGRAGVIDMPLTVGLRAAGSLQLSDLMLGVAINGRLQPQSRIANGVAVAGLFEVLDADPAVLERTRTVIEIVPAGSADPVKRLQMAARAGAAPTLMINQVEVATADLAPGRYTARAILMLDGQPIGAVSRVFEIR